MDPLWLILERRADNGGLTRPRFADQQRDTLAAGNGVLQVAQRLTVHRRKHEIARVRRQVERALTKTEELLVHQRLIEPGCRRPRRRRRQTTRRIRRSGQYACAGREDALRVTA